MPDTLTWTVHDLATASTRLQQDDLPGTERARLEEISDLAPELAADAARFSRLPRAGEAGAPIPALCWVALYWVTRDFDEDTGEWFDTGELVTDPGPYALLGLAPAAFLTTGEAGAHLARMTERLAPLNTGVAEGAYAAHALAGPLPLRRFRPEQSNDD